jgi:hypothetical protein
VGTGNDAGAIGSSMRSGGLGDGILVDIIVALVGFADDVV